jgi:heptosyltransferase-1
MKALIIKTSSMGDLIHLLPALTDAGRALPKIRFDWVAEETFAEIPSWHPLVGRVIPVNLREWVRHPWSLVGNNKWRDFYRQLRAERYDYVIDAQGLVKSALITRLARGLRCGLNWQSARESLASLAYQKRYPVLFQQHAVIRMRQLLSLALDYPMPTEPPAYGLEDNRFISQLPALSMPYVVFIHGTSEQKKLWPAADWLTLARMAATSGYSVYLPWGNEKERQRATLIAAQTAYTHVLPKLSLSQLAAILNKAKGAIAVDTGLGHLAAALSVPTVSLYNATDPYQIGTVGENQQHVVKTEVKEKNKTKVAKPLAAIFEKFNPIFCDKITPERVWDALLGLWGATKEVLPLSAEETT